MKEQTLGGKIAMLRKEQGLTQAELAEKMNVTDKAVSKWERDLSCPDIGTLPKLAEIFGLTMDELMQAKTARAGGKAENAEKLLGLVLRAVALAMGVAVVVTSLLGKIETRSAFSMMGVGLACLAIDRLRENGED